MGRTGHGPLQVEKLLASHFKSWRKTITALDNTHTQAPEKKEKVSIKIIIIVIASKSNTVKNGLDP